MDVTPQLLKDVEFREKFRGYDPDEVDDFLERVGVAFAELNDKLREAGDQVESANARTARAEARARDSSEMDDTLRRTLVLAQRTADAAVKEAEEQAAAIVAEAEARAAEQVTSSQDRASQTLAAADGESRRKLDAAEARAAQVTGEADSQASETVASAREQANRLLMDARQQSEQLIEQAKTTADERAAERRERLAVEVTALEDRCQLLRQHADRLDSYVSGHRQRLEAVVGELRDLLDDPARLAPPAQPPAPPAADFPLAPAPAGRPSDEAATDGPDWSAAATAAAGGATLAERADDDRADDERGTSDEASPRDESASPDETDEPDEPGEAGATAEAVAGPASLSEVVEGESGESDAAAAGDDLAPSEDDGDTGTGPTSELIPGIGAEAEADGEGVRAVGFGHGPDDVVDSPTAPTDEGTTTTATDAGEGATFAGSPTTTPLDEALVADAESPDAARGDTTAEVDGDAPLPSADGSVGTDTTNDTDLDVPSFMSGRRGVSADDQEPTQQIDLVALEAEGRSPGAPEDNGGAVGVAPGAPLVGPSRWPAGGPPPPPPPPSTLARTSSDARTVPPAPPPPPDGGAGGGMPPWVTRAPVAEPPPPPPAPTRSDSFLDELRRAVGDEADNTESESDDPATRFFQDRDPTDPAPRFLEESEQESPSSKSWFGRRRS